MENSSTFKFRTLEPEDIDIRVGQKKDKFTMVLLYKNARVDMSILDETVGPCNWQRDHKELKGNLYAGVALRGEDGWVWKWDCGAESNTEKEKGEASDSFKRACVNWGIGRELYSTPGIKIWNDKLEFSGSYLTTELAVSHIAYDDARHITDLTIINADTLEEVWKMQGGDVVLGVGSKNGPHKPANKPSGTTARPTASRPANGPETHEIGLTEIQEGKLDGIVDWLAQSYVPGSDAYAQAVQDFCKQNNVTFSSPAAVLLFNKVNAKRSNVR